MDTINLGGDPQKDQQPINGSKPATQPVNSSPAKAANPADISINFTPVLPNQEKKPDLLKMEVKREDLKKMDTTAATPVPEKKGFFGGLFGKKTATASKPSTAWGGALDVSKDAAIKPAAMMSMNISAKPAAPVAMSMNIGAKPANAGIALPVSGSAPTVLPPTTASVTPSAAGATVPAAKPVEFFSSSALQEKAGSSNKLIENIATQKAKLEQPKMADLLGKKSTILEKSIEEETQLNLKKKLRLVQFLAFFVTVVTLGVNGFLYYQLSPGVNLLGFVNYNFEANLRNDLFNINQSLRSVQTDLNKNNYLSGQLYLNQFGYESTRFIDGVAQLSRSGTAQDVKTEIQSVVEEAKNHMPDLLAGAKTNLLQPVVVSTFKTRGEEQTDDATETLAFQTDLRTAILAEKTALRSSSTASNIAVSPQELSLFDNAIKLVGNVKLMTNLNASTVDAFKLEADSYENDNDPAQQAAFKQFIDNLLASTKVNLATITNLRNSRIAWSNVLDRIEKITNDVNTQHNSGSSAADQSTIDYSGYEFNADTGKITINGLNTTLTGTNREVVTFLIEAFEASPEFKNVTDRSFPLAKTVDANGVASYTMNFKIDMEIEKGAFSKLNTPVADLQAKTVAYTKVPVKK